MNIIGLVWRLLLIMKYWRWCIKNNRLRHRLLNISSALLNRYTFRRYQVEPKTSLSLDPRRRKTLPELVRRTWCVARPTRIHRGCSSRPSSHINRHTNPTQTSICTTVIISSSRWWRDYTASRTRATIFRQKWSPLFKRARWARD